jgi:hypothetical protein
MSRPPYLSTRLQSLREALARLRDEETPLAHLVAAAIALHDAAPEPVVLPLLAAAGGDGGPCFRLCGPAGHWEIGIYRGISAEDQAAGRGFLLLRVSPEVLATYEGRVARIYVAAPELPEGERVLAEAAIEDGELYADISFAGLDLERRDAINVVFKARAKP